MNLKRLIVLFALVDILAALALIFQWGWLAFAGWLVLAKGAYSLAFSLSKKNWFDIFGYIDIFVGIIILAPWHMPYLWVLPMGKAALSLLGR